MWYRWDGADLIVQVRVQPRASRDELAGVQGDSLRVRLSAPPVDGAANRQLCAFLAGLCGVPPSAVSLLAGARGRDKRLRIHAPRRLPPAVEAAPAAGRTAPP